jgi:hypothetical protein
MLVALSAAPGLSLGLGLVIIVVSLWGFVELGVLRGKGAGNRYSTQGGNEAAAFE